jgi:hypothetical protein
MLKEFTLIDIDGVFLVVVIAIFITISPTHMKREQQNSILPNRILCNYKTLSYSCLPGIKSYQKCDLNLEYFTQTIFYALYSAYYSL